MPSRLPWGVTDAQDDQNSARTGAGLPRSTAITLTWFDAGDGRIHASGESLRWFELARHQKATGSYSHARSLLKKLAA